MTKSPVPVILSMLLFALCASSAPPALCASPAPPAADADAAAVAQRDAYFRESLAAIRDWETVLAGWESATPPAGRTPVLPVPADGGIVEWPHPVPERFLPYADLRTGVRLRLAGGKITVTRSDRAGRETQQAVPPGQSVVGCLHPGGGGKDRWYHRYVRRFDSLLTFRPVAGPLSVAVSRPRGLGRGGNHLRVELRNATARPLGVSVCAVLRTPGRARPCGKERYDLALAPGGRERLDIPVQLDRPGGGLVIVTVRAGGQTFWIPVFTHVEDVAAVLAGIEGILADVPDAAASARLADLRRRAEPWRPDPPDQAGPAWRALFEEAGRLRDRLLLGRVRFGAMLFVRRKPFDSEQPFMDAHHLINRPGGGIYRLAPPGPGGKVTPVVTSLGQGVYRDVCLHWRADRIVFAFGNGSDKWDGRQSYHIYEQRLDPAGGPRGKPRQLTHGPRNDCEPFYLPGEQIGFTSDRSDHFVMCGGDRHAPALFVMNADGSGVRQLSFNVFNDYNPTVLPDGRILYCRWEYNERSVTSLHTPFTMNPDGTMVETYYGNATIRPNVVMFPRPVPGSTKITALLTAHHGQTHGAIGLIDTQQGLDGPGPLTVLTPGVPVTGEKARSAWAPSATAAAWGRTRRRRSSTTSPAGSGGSTPSSAQARPGEPSCSRSLQTAGSSSTAA